MKHPDTADPTTSFWLEHSIEERREIPVQDADAPLPNEVVDVVILGGGLTGISTAYWCHQHGLSTDVIDARSLCGGATGRNGGHLCPSLSSSFEGQAVEELVEFIRTHSIQCDLENGGLADLYRVGEQLPGIDSEETVARRWESEIVQDNMSSKAGSFSCALLNPKAWQFWPAKLVFALAKLAAASGCRIFEHTQALSISKKEDLDVSIVQTSRGEIKACNVVIALNGFSSTVVPSLKDILIPCKNQVLVTRPAPMMWKCGLSVGDGSDEIYGLQRMDGRIVLGGSRVCAPDGAKYDSNDIGDDVLHPKVSQALRVFLESNFKQDVEVENEWAGVLGFTKDRLPMVGLLPEAAHSGIRVFIGAGYCGHGMPYCFAVGRHLVELITNASQVTYPYLLELSPTAPSRNLFTL